MPRVSVVESDITTLEVDAIVNAANEGLLGGGGVDGAIHRAAGPQLLEACFALPEVRPGVRCPTGESRITPGFNLPSRYVVHTVGPVWHGGSAGESDLLWNCYAGSLALAREHELTSIAFPAISCGVFGYPAEKAASVARDAVSTVLAAAGSIQEVLMVAFGEPVKRALEAEFGSQP